MFRNMEYTSFKTERRGGFCLVTLDRQQSLNALNLAFFQDMNAFLDEIASWLDLRVLIITGAGKAFAAGADISELVNKDKDAAISFSQLGQKVFRRLELLDQPVIAAINGFALGGGLELAMACDFRIASSGAKFGQPEVNLGLIPGYAGTQRLPLMVGLSNALYMLTTGEMITAGEALNMGFVQKVVQPENLMTETLRIANVIASKGRQAVKAVKAVTRMGFEEDFEKGCTMESLAFGSLFGDEGSEGREGMKAFLEKRKPTWSIVLDQNIST